MDSIIEKSKSDQIIETAQKWFGQYGIEKTSMRDIADDLKLSKASLYYYFPDKESLYRAVVEKEQIEFLAKISEDIIKEGNPEMLLREFAVKRLSYFRTLLNLSRLRLEAYSDLKPFIRDMMLSFREREKDIVIRIFDLGIKKGLFSIPDMDQTASLFLDLLRGLRSCVMGDKKTMTIEQEEYEKLHDKTVVFMDFFIKGIKA